MIITGSITYEIIAEIGAGEGMNSKVFEARDVQVAGRIAVKEIPKSNLGNRTDEYFREAQALFASASTNVVRLHFAAQTPDRICLGMPLYRGSVAKLTASSPVRLSESIQLQNNILNGLSQIHRAQFLHLDVRPTNVLIDANGQASVADFGQARRISATGTVAAPKMYHLAFPPEVHRYSIATVPSDIYQAGVLFYRLLNGDEFFNAQKTGHTEVTLLDRILKGKFPDPRRFLPHVPRSLRRVCRKAMSVDPAKRYQSASEFTDALARASYILDWRCTRLPGGGMKWTTERAGRPGLEIDLTPCGTELWSIEPYQMGRQKRRLRRSMSADGVTAARAHQLLTELFEELA